MRVNAHASRLQSHSPKSKACLQRPFHWPMLGFYAPTFAFAPYNFAVSFREAQSFDCLCGSVSQPCWRMRSALSRRKSLTPLECHAPSTIRCRVRSFAKLLDCVTHLITCGWCFYATIPGGRIPSGVGWLESGLFSAEKRPQQAWVATAMQGGRQRGLPQALPVHRAVCDYYLDLSS
jgi:hypothetical protein